MFLLPNGQAQRPPRASRVEREGHVRIAASHWAEKLRFAAHRSRANATLVGHILRPGQPMHHV